jgi:ATP-dependent DNA ligase
MKLPIPFDYPPMEADTAREIPDGPLWQYEPKWDGFRCLAFRRGRHIELMSKSGQPLARYFPELTSALLDLKAEEFVLDGEIIIHREKIVDFDALLQRIHPAESRIRKLSVETPAELVVFDLLVTHSGANITGEPLERRRRELEAFAQKFFKSSSTVRLSPATREFKHARSWLKEMAGALDGVIAKRVDLPYNSGERHAMVKIKNLRTADCVVGGFRYGSKSREVGSLLLGLYNEEGLLDHVGFTSAIPRARKQTLTGELEPLIEPPGFTGAAPGGPSRWSTERSGEWKPLAPKLVVEVQYDHFSGRRFRHGTKLLRFRPDKRPKSCTIAQVRRESRSPLDLLR